MRIDFFFWILSRVYVKSNDLLKLVQIQLVTKKIMKERRNGGNHLKIARELAMWHNLVNTRNGGF
jgi:hypothetical protein